MASEEGRSPKKVRPGGELDGRPVQGGGGCWYDKYGKTIPNPSYVDMTELRSNEYATEFWERNHPPGMREAMIENLERAKMEGSFSVVVSGDRGITESDKQRLVAYLQLAEELDIKVGDLQYNDRAHTVTAKVE